MTKVKMLQFIINDAEATVAAATKAKKAAHDAYYLASESLGKAEYALHFARQQMQEALVEQTNKGERA